MAAGRELKLMKAYAHAQKKSRKERHKFGDIFAIQLMKAGAEMDMKWRSERKRCKIILRL